MDAPRSPADVVTRYRQLLATPAAEGAPHLELEVRFQDVRFAQWRAVLEAALAGRLAPSGAGHGGRVTHTVNAILADQPARRETGGGRTLRPARIRQMTFAAGARVADEYVRKTPLLPPYRLAHPFALSYLVALAAEAPDRAFDLSDGALIRVRARAEFPFTLPAAELAAEDAPPLAWRLDLTVARQLSGAHAAAALKDIVDRMFRTREPMAPENMLALLGLAGPEPAGAELYRFEAEVEFVGGAAGAAALRGADVTAAADAVLRLVNPEYQDEAAYQAEVFRVAGHLIRHAPLLEQFRARLGLKDLLPQVVPLTRADYAAMYPPAGLYVADKTDGYRAVASARDGRCVVLAERLRTFEPPPAADPGGRARLAAATVVDGEFVPGAAGAPGRFLAFDLIALAGTPVVDRPFEERLALLGDAVALLREYGLAAEVKRFDRVPPGAGPADLERLFRGLAGDPGRDFEGFILVEPGAPYLDTVTRKWKDAAHLTVDFLARRAPGSVLGRAPFLDAPGHALHFLFVGVGADDAEALGLVRCPGYADLFDADAGRARGERGAYFPIQFAPSDAPLAFLYQHPRAPPAGWPAGDPWPAAVDGRIVELRCSGGCLGAGAAATVAWELVRIRDDRERELQARRYFGNNFRVAELTWVNYLAPFELRELWEGPDLGYFRASKGGAYRAQTALTSFVKSQGIAQLADAEWVVDLCVGRGADLGRYYAVGVRNLVGVDRDRNALIELVRRKYNHIRRARKPPGGEAALYRRGARRRLGGTAVHVVAADVGAPAAATLALLRAVGVPPAGADAVVCNLAAHYFAGSPDAIANFAALCAGAVRLGGTVRLTAMLGARVHALFTELSVPPGGTWELREEDALKFALRRDYSAGALAPAGQHIGVLLPFSDGHFYDECLVNVSAFTTAFTARGFRHTATRGFDLYFGDFAARNLSLAERLSDADHQYLRLYGEIVYTRGK